MFDRQPERVPSVGGDGPTEERPGVDSGSGPGGEPGVDVGLGGADEIGVPRAEPVEEPDSDVGLGPDHRVAALGELSRLCQTGEAGAVVPT